MKTKHQKTAAALIFLAAFLLWTIAVRRVDVAPIGPESSSVGFSTLNAFLHARTGVHPALYTLTDWLGLVPLLVMLGFALLGLVQWCRRGRLSRVDRSLFALGGLYLAVAAAWLFFEGHPVNYRPVLIGGRLEASYPSSTTLLVLTVMPSAMLQLHARIQNPRLKRGVLTISALFTGLMVAGRLLSGVHWLSDIIGGALLSAGLVLLYAAVV